MWEGFTKNKVIRLGILGGGFCTKVEIKRNKVLESGCKVRIENIDMG